VSDSVLRVTVLPRSSVTRIVGFEGDTLRVKVQGAPVDGEANKDLIALLSKHLKVPKKRIEIISGHSSRKKLIKLRNISNEDLSRYLSL
jgi:uncharacterized protein (TIGR00251 family)